MITCATSSGSPKRPRVVRLATAASQGDASTLSDEAGPSMGVRVTPGATALTRRPSGPHSSAAVRTSVERAAFDAL